MAITCLNKPVVFLQIKRIRALCGQQLQKNDTKTWILKSPWKDSPRTNQKQKRLWGDVGVEQHVAVLFDSISTSRGHRNRVTGFLYIHTPMLRTHSNIFLKGWNKLQQSKHNYYCSRLGMWQHARDLMLGTIIPAFKTTCRAVVNTKFDTHSAHQPIKVRYLLIYCASL